ncbi:MAG TPA: hypothetical protein VHW93_01690 [Acidimicrobiales bacterium]|jgi:hypothetical protein|nr:hypothetical protein [Acidimicrobiales bacterium]
MVPGAAAAFAHPALGSAATTAAWVVVDPVDVVPVVLGVVAGVEAGGDVVGLEPPQAEHTIATTASTMPARTPTLLDPSRPM